MKMCRYHPDKRCYHSSCSIFDSLSGNVEVCELHPNPFGFFSVRKVSPVHGSVSKHLRRKVVVVFG
jgi:hypothetical protein